MGGSGSNSSSTTSKSSVPAYVKPYEQQQQNVASNLFTGQNYPQQNVAPFSPAQQSAFSDITGMTPQQQQYATNAESANNQLATGQNQSIQQAIASLLGISSGQNTALQGSQSALSNIASGQNPALNTSQGALSNIATGQNQQLNQANQAAQGLINDPTVSAAQQANQKIAQGANLNADTNTALQSYLQAGYQPMAQEYQNVTAPNIIASNVLTGNLGSSGMQQEQNLANSQFAQELGNYTANVVEPAYEQGLSQQEQAIQNTTGLLQPKVQGAGLLQGSAQQQAGAATGLQGVAGEQANAAQGLQGVAGQQTSAAAAVPGQFAPQLGALGDVSNLTSNAYTPAQQELNVGQQQQQQAQNILNTIFGNQMTPYQMAQQGAGLISDFSGQGGQSFQVTGTPGGGSMKG